jgi:Ni/Co efflux regulator RcnB
MMRPKTMVIGAVAAGLVAAGAASTLAAAPSTASTAIALSAFSAPLDDNHNGDRGHDGNWDRHRDWDGDRGRNGGWQGHPWRWWHDWGVSADTCRDGGGHVNWDRHRCDGGRFDDFHVR